MRSPRPSIGPPAPFTPTERPHRVGHSAPGVPETAQIRAYPRVFGQSAASGRPREFPAPRPISAVLLESSGAPYKEGVTGSSPVPPIGATRYAPVVRRCGGGCCLPEWDAPGDGRFLAPKTYAGRAGWASARSAGLFLRVSTGRSAVRWTDARRASLTGLTDPAGRRNQEAI